MSWFIPTLWWYLATLLATIACMPITIYLFRRCMGQGAGFARPVAMLVSIWPAWFLAGVFQGMNLWTGAILWATLAVIGVLAWVRAFRHRLMTTNVLYHYGLAELMYLVVFAAFLWFRGFGPSLDHTEKPGELMMLSSVMHSTSMPPQDAWFSGHTLNYYYLGYAIWGGFGKMTSIAPAEVFNLALISTFAMTAVAVAALIAVVLGRFYSELTARIGGIVGMIMLLLMGNPWASWNGLGEGGDVGYWQGIGWHASRIIKDAVDPNYGYNPITEFPAFSFILGDLHPHVMALPFAITALGIAWVFLTLGRLPEMESFWRRDLGILVLGGGMLGSLYALNSWDFPTYAGIALLALLLGTVGLGWKRQLGAVAVVMVSTVFFWLPFHRSFEAPSNPIDSRFSEIVGHIPVVGRILEGIGVYQGMPTSPGSFFNIFGFQYAVLLALILCEALRRRQPLINRRLRKQGELPYNDPLVGYFAIGFGVLCLIGAIVLPVHLLLFCGLPVIVIWLLLERDARLTPANVSLVLFALALLLLLIPEFFFISDIYGGSRMNTVFKVSYQVWLLMSVASGIGVIAIWKSVRFSSVGRVLMPAALTAMLAYGLVYPVVAGRQWLDWQNPDRNWVGIDGLAYLNRVSGSSSPTDTEVMNQAEYDAIAWLREHAGADDVILTSGGGEWNAAVGRVSGGSGVPTLMGWIGHERQWHLGDAAVLAELPQRIADINALYAFPLNNELLDAYGVTFIYIGPGEIAGVPGSPAADGSMSITPVEVASNPDFPGEGWNLVFEQDGVRIYQRSGD